MRIRPVWTAIGSAAGYSLSWTLAWILAYALAGTIYCHAGEPQWVEVRSANFSVITDAGEKRGRDVVLHFEQMRSVFGTLMTRATVNLTVPLQIVAFRSTKEMRQVSPLFNGKPTELAGLFQGGDDRTFIMLDMSVEDPWSVVFHEYAHRLMDGLSFRTAPWFEEGFAEYFSSIEVDNKEARVGKIPHETYEILEHTGMMKMSDLLRVQQNTKVYNETGDHRTVFYAEAGLVVHYLYDNNLIPKLSVYFDTLQIAKKSPEQAFEAAFGMTTEQFDKVLRSYMNSRRYLYAPVKTPAGIATAQFTVAPVSPIDAQVLMADIHAHNKDYQAKALGEFQEVLKTDPNNEAALRGAGFAYMQQNDLAHAEEYLRRAAQRDSADPRVHLYYATLLNQQGHHVERSEEIKKELKTAIALDPTLADAYSLLGYTQAISGEPVDGIASLKKALELSPRNEHYMFNLASAYLANRKPDASIEILQKLSGSSDPQIAVFAKQSLAQAIDYEDRTKSSTKTVTKTVTGTSGNMPLELKRRTAGGSESGTGSSASEASPPDAGAIEAAATAPEAAQAPPTPPPVHFLKGKLVAVDCSAAPQVVLTVASGKRSVQVHIRDRAHVVLIGADEFSCGWTNRNVAVNYRESGDGGGDVVSLEMQ